LLLLMLISLLSLVVGTATPDDNSILPIPNHVVLNHLTASAIRNGVLAVGTTTRYKRKVRFSFPSLTFVVPSFEPWLIISRFAVVQLSTSRQSSGNRSRSRRASSILVICQTSIPTFGWIQAVHLQLGSPSFSPLCFGCSLAVVYPLRPLFLFRVYQRSHAFSRDARQLFLPLRCHLVSPSQTCRFRLVHGVRHLQDINRAS
jgi:hypothetical protein